MNILFITQTEVNPHAGGVQRVTFTLGVEFTRLGHNVFYLAVAQRQKKVSDDTMQFLLPMPNDLDNATNIKYVEQLLVRLQIKFIVNQVGIFPEINHFLSAIDRKGAKLINVHHNCVSCLNARYRDIVLGNHQHSKLWKILGKLPVWAVLRLLNRIRYGGFFKNALHNADVLMLLSPAYIAELDTFGISPSTPNVVAIGNPLSLRTPSVVTEKDNRIIYVGRLSLTQKRVDKLLKIWQRLHESFPTWEFDVVGDGEQRKTMEKFVRDHSMGRVHFHGTRDPRPFLEKAKFFTSTSDFEGYPMVVVEAQSYGVVPVVYNSFSAVNEMIIDGETGFIVPDLSIEAYVRKMTDVIRTVDDSKFSEMRAAMRQKVEQTVPEIVGKQWIDLFNRLNEKN